MPPLSRDTGRMQRFVDVGFDANKPWRSATSGYELKDRQIRELWQEGKCTKEDVILHVRKRNELAGKAMRFVISLNRYNAKIDVSEGQVDNFLYSTIGTDNAPGPQRNAGDWTALHLAAANGQDETVEFLVANGADINSASQKLCACCISTSDEFHRGRLNWISPASPLWTPLHSAICHGRLSTSQLLLALGASVALKTDSLKELHPEKNASQDAIGPKIATTAYPATAAEPNARGRYTTLHAASYHGLLELMRTLLQDSYQSEIDVKDGIGQTPLAYAYCAGDFIETMPYLLGKGADIDIVLSSDVIPRSVRSVCAGPLYATPLFMACHVCRDDDAINLIKLEYTPLHECAFSAGRLEVTRKLIAAGAEIDPLSRGQRTPLHHALTSLNFEIAGALIRAGANVSARDHNDEIPLIQACKMNNGGLLQVETVSLLICHGADVNARGPNNNTALHDIRSSHEDRILELLMDHGADTTLKNRSGLLPFQSAFYYYRIGGCHRLLDEQVRALLTKDDIVHMFRSFLSSRHKDVAIALLEVLLDADGSALLDEPEILKMALDYGNNHFTPFLVSEKAFESFISNSNVTFLHIGCQSGLFRRTSIIAKLLEAGVKLNTGVMTENGETLLYLYLQQLEILWVQLWMVKRISPDQDAAYFSYERPLDIAISRLQEVLVHNILRRYPLQGNTSSYSCLHRACSFHIRAANPHFVRFLLEQGLDANGISCFGETPLFHMLHTFESGPLPGSASNSGLGPACSHQYMALKHVLELVDCIGVLVEYGAKWSIRNQYSRNGRWTPIEELQHLLEYNGTHAQSQMNISILEAELRQIDWDENDVGEDFFLLKK
ncbi:ankyrin [Xylariaceae sp. FL1651]|nr:ankyrin [Xylariaceae sp. FL1651]